MKTTQQTQDRALQHMRQAQSFGFHGKSMVCDYAVAAMEAENFDADNAALAAEIVWARHFSGSKKA